MCCAVQVPAHPGYSMPTYAAENGGHPVVRPPSLVQCRPVRARAPATRHGALGKDACPAKRSVPSSCCSVQQLLAPCASPTGEVWTCILGCAHRTSIMHRWVWDFRHCIALSRGRARRSIRLAGRACSLCCLAGVLWRAVRHVVLVGLACPPGFVVLSCNG